MTLLIEVFLGFLGIYLTLGLVYSIYFYVKGGAQIDEGVKATPWHFKWIIFPGVVLFWSLLLKKHIKKS